MYTKWDNKFKFINFFEKTPKISNNTSKYQYKRPSKFIEEKQIPYLLPCETSHKKIKNP
jgi:hypothetical protein